MAKSKAAKSKKKASSKQSKKRVQPKKVSKGKAQLTGKRPLPQLKMRSMATKAKPATKGAERRTAHRHFVKNLWVTEFSDDYQFLVQASDISEGGIFLKQRLKTDAASSMLRLNLGKLGALRVVATPVYDRLTDDSYGTGYQFQNLTTDQAKALKNFLRNL